MKTPDLLLVKQTCNKCRGRGFTGPVTWRFMTRCSRCQGSGQMRRRQRKG